MAIKASCTITISKYRDTDSVTRYYILQSSTASVPAKPTTLTPSGWTTIEPDYTSGDTNTLYFTDRSVFSDGTFSYSDVSKSSSYEAAKEAYNKALSVENCLDSRTSEVIVGTQTATTAAWTGVASFKELKDGQQITYWLPQTSAANVTLNLTLADGSTTGAINCYYSGTSRLGTHYAAGNIVRLVYRKDTTIGTSTTKYTGWWADANYNTNDNTYDRIKYSNSIKAKTAITASTLNVGDSSGYFKLVAGSIFDIDKPILWASSAIAKDATGNNNYLAMPSCTLRNNTSSTWTATQYKTLYLVGILEGQIFTIDSDTPFTTTIPESDDGKYYISLGYMYSTYQMYLYPEHPIFKYVTDGFKSLNQVAYEAQSEVDTKASSDELSKTNETVNSNYKTAIQMIDSINAIIQNLVVDENGNSLMTQTGDGWQFDMSSFQNSLDTAKDDIKELQTSGDLTALQKQIDTLNERTAYIRMTTTDDGDPCLELGKDGSNFKVRITNNIIQFLDGSNTAAAYISGSIFYGNNIVAKNSLQIGESTSYVWQVRANGNLGLTYKSS